MRRFIAFLAVLTALITGSALLAAGAQAATGPSGTRVVTADRAAQGERVVVTLSATCPAGATIKVLVTVTAANDDRIAQGTRQKKADCTGVAQPIELRVERNPIGADFVVGPATATTVRTVCDAADCDVIAFDETIRIS
ncbi:hypothetical protein [Actinoplanes sp. M2I2]|uniref:hypothetical protein n=1 Tax=Actinoplanes sp. M2I2 TaxID=1734444 RepID=UPI002021A679|nr:hypothetical protein [Actinoplanes sp. M2I2]